MINLEATGKACYLIILINSFYVFASPKKYLLVLISTIALTISVHVVGKIRY